MYMHNFTNVNHITHLERGSGAGVRQWRGCRVTAVAEGLRLNTAGFPVWQRNGAK